MLALLLAAAPVSELPTVRLSADRPITRSVRVRPGVYRLGSPESLDKAALVIRGDNLVVDFQGATLEGTPPTTDPDQRKGVGIEVQGRNVTLLNARVRGYKVGLIARNAPGLRILDGDFSYNWKQRLQSTVEQEDAADWMSFHRNEKDEWLRYGAGIYLRNCDGFEVRGTTIRGGQCGLMIMETDHGLVWNNDFSFNSAVGFGMYLSSDNRILHNRMDWNLRGYSHGRWNRGQDSTGILIYEQCHRNVFAYNSVTHSGDGFFLWAGQTSMDTGQGGCNDNLLYGNDWSHAPTNGIEATFSRNRFVNNLILECWHGVWGGYSFDTLILGNVFGLNGESIAIEHGQNSVVRYNAFDRDHISLYFWQNARQDPNWGFPKFKDTRNVGTRVERNVVRDATGTAVELGTSFGLTFRDNVFERNARLLRARPYENGSSESLWTGNRGANAVADLAGEGVFDNGNALKAGAEPRYPEAMLRSGNVVLGLDPETTDYLKRFDVPWNPWPAKGALLPSTVAAALPADEAVRAEREIREHAVAPLPGGIDPFLKPGTLRGRRYMIVDEWGPYDFQRPLLWPREATAVGGGVAIAPDGTQVTGQPSGAFRFEILGPAGRWRVKSVRGVELDAREGTVPGFVTATWRGSASDVAIELEYVGGATVDVRGVRTPAGRPVAFGWSQSRFDLVWDVKFYTWTQAANPADPNSAPDEAALQEVFRGKPVLEQTLPTLNLAGGVQGLPANRWATRAESNFEVPAGEYEIAVTTDDGARVWLDGKPLIEDAWKYQGPNLYTRRVRLGGKHTLRVEHFQIAGYAALKVAIRRL